MIRTEPLISEVIHVSGERNGVPVEVAMTYNTSFAENLFSYVNNINTHGAVRTSPVFAVD